jgi:hypothetical protein
MKVATLVEQGDIDLFLPECLSGKEVITKGGSNYLSTSVWGTISWETGIDPICPGGGLIASTI